MPKITNPWVLLLIGAVLIGLTVIDLQEEKYRGIPEEAQKELPVEEQEELKNQKSVNEMVHKGLALSAIISFVLALYFVPRDCKEDIQEDNEKRKDLENS